MEYKGYLALVEFDDSTGVLHGRAVDGGPYPVATFETTDTRALRREFERSVDEYLGWCEEDGVAPGGDARRALASPWSRASCRGGDGSRGGGDERRCVNRPGASRGGGEGVG